SHGTRILMANFEMVRGTNKTLTGSGFSRVGVAIDDLSGYTITMQARRSSTDAAARISTAATIDGGSAIVQIEPEDTPFATFSQVRERLLIGLQVTAPDGWVDELISDTLTIHCDRNR